MYFNIYCVKMICLYTDNYLEIICCNYYNNLFPDKALTKVTSFYIFLPNYAKRLKIY